MFILQELCADFNYSKKNKMSAGIEKKAKTLYKESSLINQLTNVIRLLVFFFNIVIFFLLTVFIHFSFEQFTVRRRTVGNGIGSGFNRF